MNFHLKVLVQINFFFGEAKTKFNSIASNDILELHDIPKVHKVDLFHYFTFIRKAVLPHDCAFIVHDRNLLRIN